MAVSLQVSFRVADVLRDVAELELLQAPGLPYIIPRDYVNLPHLTGGPRPPNPLPTPLPHRARPAHFCLLWYETALGLFSYQPLPACHTQLTFPLPDKAERCCLNQLPVSEFGSD